MSAIHHPNPLSTSIALVGLGLSNRALEKLLHHLGYGADSIFHFDDKEAEGVINDPSVLKQKGVQTLIVSPGYPLSREWIQQMRADGVFVSSELAFAGRFLEGEKLLGVTGSLGKSTTTSLAAVGLEAAKKKVFVGGNLGYPLADYVLQVLKGERPRADWVVLELSSFQLENLGSLHFDYSLFTYFCSNHLERYAGLDEYYQTKASLLARTRKQAFANAQSAELLSYFKKHSLDQVEWSDVATQKYFSDEEWKQKNLVGTHNQENLSLVARFLDEVKLWNKSSKKALLEFKGLPHRMELLDSQGPFFVNDSKATAMESVRSAVNSVLEESRFQEGHGKLWVLLGGRDKKLPWKELAALASVAESKIAFVFFGECRKTASEQSGLKGAQFSTLRLALEDLQLHTLKNDWILLSPGGTSLDEFKNFEDRGRMFSRWVKEIWK